MVLAVINESPKTETEANRERLRYWYRYDPNRIGLPEVDKLLAEQEVIDPVSNCTSTGVKFLDGDKDMGDHISRLPSEFLQYVISLLTTREGAATSILSTRWRHLWSSSATCLNFDDVNVLGHEYPYDIVRDNVLKERLRTRFITRVDHICQLRRASKMDTFWVSFPLYDNFAGHIDKWMELAAAQGAAKVMLDFRWHTRIRIPGGNNYMFPFQEFGSSLKYLTICNIQIPPNFQVLKSLTSLRLCQCPLTDMDVQNILSNCLSLQWLSLRGCDFPDHTSLEFVGPSIQIKHLHINCYKVKKIKVQDNTSLLSLELIAEPDDPKLSIKNVPHLRSLLLCTLGPVKILGDLPCLETLFLQREEVELPKLSLFKNLKRLVFTDDGVRSNLVEVLCFLEACPLLQQLDLEMHLSEQDFDEQNDAEFEGQNDAELEGLNSEVAARPRCSHHNLKEVNIYGFDSHPEIIELARYLVENATVLEKMIISRKSRTYVGNGAYDCSKRRSKLYGMSQEKVCKLLQEKARPATEIIFV